MSKQAEFRRCLSKLADGACCPNPIVRAAAIVALEHILQEARRILSVVQAEELMLDGWDQAGKG